MVTGVESSSQSSTQAPMRIRMLGPLSISRGGVDVPLPASRKVRALFAYLAMAPRPVARNAVVRTAVGRAERSARRIALVPEQDPSRGRRARATARADGRRYRAARSVGLLRRRARGAARAPKTASSRWRSNGSGNSDELFTGEFLEGLDIDRSPMFDALAHRATPTLARLPNARCSSNSSSALPDEEAFGYLEQWLQLAPFDRARARTCC